MVLRGTLVVTTTFCSVIGRCRADIDLGPGLNSGVELDLRHDAGVRKGWENL
jgi:hypothetical protein